jgi:hypothetical protein
MSEIPTGDWPWVDAAVIRFERGDRTVQVWGAVSGREILTLEGAYRGCRRRGIQPRRQADRLGQYRSDG